MVCVNKFCWCGTVASFIAIGRDEWLTRMRKEYPRVFPFPLTPQQEAAWSHSYDALSATFQALGPAYKNLHLIFEYGLPKWPPTKTGRISKDHAIYADCVLVAKKEVVILEFKDRDLSDREVARKLSLSVRRYRNRIQKFHDQSRGFSKRGVLISTVNTEILRQSIKGITLCSADKLGEAIAQILGPRPTRIRSVVAWRETTYSVH